MLLKCWLPQNYPFHNVASAAVAALFAGNAAVIKVSECSLSSKDYFEKLFRKVLAARGHNPELVTLLVGEGETGAALVKSGVDKILFIGSPAVGKRVMEGASANLTPVILELGGKDPFIGISPVLPRSPYLQAAYEVPLGNASSAGGCRPRPRHRSCSAGSVRELWPELHRR